MSAKPNMFSGGVLCVKCSTKLLLNHKELKLMHQQLNVSFGETFSCHEQEENCNLFVGYSQVVIFKLMFKFGTEFKSVREYNIREMRT